MRGLIMRSWFKMSFILMLAKCPSLALANSDDCSPEAPLQAPHAVTGETCPDIGRMGSTKLAIPRHYILGPDFVYDGVDIWNAESYKKRPKKQSFDLGIRYFSIRIRLNNFKPVENEQDLRDFANAENMVWTLPPRNNQWVFVQFNYPSPFENNDRQVDMRPILQRYVNNKLGNWPLMMRQKDDVNGLEHYMAEKPLSAETRAGEINEVFYDARSNRTLITCENKLRSVPPHDPLSFCHHYFYTTKGDVSIEIGNIRDKQYYLSRWSEIEKGTLAVFSSFIVP